MRFLGVADAARSAAFYRDVLGFEIRDRDPKVEAISGPARLELGTDDYGPRASEGSRPTGSAVVFFETGDVEAMHAWIRAQGGHPSGLERINRVKMRAFEIRDPDGHSLWFGQSYDLPVDSRPPAMLQKALPNFPMRDVAAGVDYYVNVLGFKINYQQRDLGVMDRDAVTFLLVARGPKDLGNGSAYVYVKDADALYAELQAKGAKLDGEPVSHPWGLRDLKVTDLEGNQIRFGQPFE